MDPTQTEEEIERARLELERAQHHLQASLTTPAPSPTTSENGSISSGLDTLTAHLQAQSALLDTQNQRIDQLAKTLLQDHASTEKINSEMLQTMQLMQVMIAETDKQQATLVDLMERQETATAALVRVNANLSQIVAALVGPPPEKG